MYLCLAMCGECGEVANLQKKMIRDKTDHTERILEELGDVLYYVATYAEKLGSSLDQIAHANLEKLKEHKLQE